MNSVLHHLKTTDEKILKFFNHNIKSKFLDSILPKITYLGSIPFTYLFCLTLSTIPLKSLRSLGRKCSLSLVLSSILVFLIKKLVNRKRPFLKLKNLHIRKIHIDPYSFPSGHTAMAFSIAVMLSLSLSFIDILLIPLAMLVGISRMYTGVHYPTDVFIGMLIGSICSICIYFIM
ncbi:phosphatase PAP2 family protein [Hathewaya limosa]|uniref:Undecaprenyl-diphosphatase n=1 Tax=Hathewaya limosa TaxID=1536 RepID=A0ABU0JQZ4_HATLI|nr:phosphatase PAP2 family protein [Hathewaya limosa]MDQ0478598.1 undecaprenyl-diphosphatase [Hathewaya limosa]